MRSSTKTEYRALAQAANEVIWFQSLFSELKLSLYRVPIIWCDNTGATFLAHNSIYHARTKHIELDLHFLRDKITTQVFEVHFVPSNDQLADIFTKPLSSPRFDKLKSKLILNKTQLNLRGDVESSFAAVTASTSGTGAIVTASNGNTATASNGAAAIASNDFVAGNVLLLLQILLQVLIEC
ncbi:hypothetical protein ACOSQ2_019920 [Xanthoceras sorbifolium]